MKKKEKIVKDWLTDYFISQDNNKSGHYWGDDYPICDKEGLIKRIAQLLKDLENN